MEAKEKKQKKESDPHAYTYVDGKRVVFKYERKSDKLSAYGIWLKEHPNGIGKILDWRAAMK
ncbi:hypothetical protein FACS1894182_02740 [Bacteroidia bacterium]|nr:hypothetical protein FACS1894182_02740 [Bacteroidia bacterium]